LSAGKDYEGLYGCFRLTSHCSKEDLRDLSMNLEYFRVPWLIKSKKNIGYRHYNYTVTQLYSI